jgi:GNAT superfamily N-acetyltransferase
MDSTVAFVIRPMAGSDINGVLAMQAGSFTALAAGHHTAEQLAAHAALIRSTHYRAALAGFRMVVAVAPDGAILGSAGWCPAERPSPGARIRKVFVVPGHAGLGLGRRLVEAAEADARTAGHRHFTVRANANAAPFYERLGYRPLREGWMDAAGGIGLPVVFMGKPETQEPAR